MSKILETDKTHVANQYVMQKRADRAGTLELTNDQRALALGIYFDANGVLRMHGKHGSHSKTALNGAQIAPKSLRNGTTRMVNVR